MSTASQGLQLTRIKNGVSYSAMLFCNKGDLFQQYNAQKVMPNFTSASDQPIVTFVCATTSTTDTVAPTIKVYWDDVEVTFSNLNAGTTNNAVTGLAAGTIKIEQKGDPGSNQPWKLRFVKNIASATSTTLVSHTLKVEGIFAAGRVIAVKPFTLSPLTESGETVHIVSGTSDATPFVVNQNLSGSKCTLVAQVYRAGEPLSSLSGYTFQWYKKNVSVSSGWESISGATQSSLQVAASDVDSYAEYRVVVTHNGTQFSDTQSVMDVGDPYYVNVTVKDGSGATASSSMNGDVSAGEKRVYKASLASRAGGSVPAMKSVYWLISTIDGVVQNAFPGTSSQEGVASRTTNTDTLEISAAWVDSLNGGAGVDCLDITVTVNF